MTDLSVNVNKLAWIRNSRGHNNPNVSEWSQKILDMGVNGITVHPRPDGRHIRHSDVTELSALLENYKKNNPSRSVEFNIEGYPSEDFLALVTSVPADQVTLVPDPPEALTSNAGWKIAENLDLLKRVIGYLKQRNRRVSLFIEPSAMTESDWLALAETRTDRVELYTEAFAKAYAENSTGLKSSLALYAAAAERAKSLKIGVNAGHDLSQDNLAAFLKSVPGVQEVSIGHALICEALEQGMKTTISNYLKICRA